MERQPHYFFAESEWKERKDCGAFKKGYFCIRIGSLSWAACCSAASVRVVYVNLLPAWSGHLCFSSTLAMLATFLLRSILLNMTASMHLSSTGRNTVNSMHDSSTIECHVVIC